MSTSASGHSSTFHRRSWPMSRRHVPWSTPVLAPYRVQCTTRTITVGKDAYC